MKGQQVGVVLVGMLLLTGCSSNMVWMKDGATQQQFQADQFDCKQKAYTMSGGYNSNNLGALVVSAPGFFNECMEAKGYRLMPQDQAVQQSTENVNARIRANLAHQGKVWIKATMNIPDAETDYRVCDGAQGTPQARTCMEAIGYRLIYPSTLEPTRMTRPDVTQTQGWADKIACDAPVFEDVKACLRTKGYVDLPVGAPEVAQRAAQ